MSALVMDGEGSGGRRGEEFSVAGAVRWQSECMLHGRHTVYGRWALKDEDGWEFHLH